MQSEERGIPEILIPVCCPGCNVSVVVVSGHFFPLFPAPPCFLWAGSDAVAPLSKKGSDGVEVSSSSLVEAALPGRHHETIQKLCQAELLVAVGPQPAVTPAVTRATVD